MHFNLSHQMPTHVYLNKINKLLNKDLRFTESY